MRSKDAPELSDAALREIIDGWHANIGKAIIETWGLPETLQNAVEHQDEFELEFDGEVTLAEVLVAAKLVQRGEQDLKRYPSLRRVGIAPGDMDKHADEIKAVRSSLSE
jgi:HD-like signal output (HDOD) protein